MNRDKFFGIDAKKQWVFVFLLENNDKKLSLFIEYTNEENWNGKTRFSVIWNILGYRFNC